MGLESGTGGIQKERPGSSKKPAGTSKDRDRKKKDRLRDPMADNQQAQRRQRIRDQVGTDRGLYDFLREEANRPRPANRNRIDINPILDSWGRDMDRENEGRRRAYADYGQTYGPQRPVETLPLRTPPRAPVQPPARFNDYPPPLRTPYQSDQVYQRPTTIPVDVPPYWNGDQTPYAEQARIGSAMSRFGDYTQPYGNAPHMLNPMGKENFMWYGNNNMQNSPRANGEISMLERFRQMWLEAQMQAQMQGYPPAIQTPYR